jgi:23S rRNA (cytidine1920-2'-O)/16S rRNA (cytidine1409-2'-O)-methyltransferase
VVKNWFDFSPLTSRSEEVKSKKGEVLALIKPQFEAGKKDVARGDGVIRDPEIHRQVLLDILSFAIQTGFSLRALLKSPLLGPKGNVEFLLWLDFVMPGLSVEELVAGIIQAEK